MTRRGHARAAARPPGAAAGTAAPAAAAVPSPAGAVVTGGARLVPAAAGPGGRVATALTHQARERGGSCTVTAAVTAAAGVSARVVPASTATGPTRRAPPAATKC